MDMKEMIRSFPNQLLEQYDALKTIDLDEFSDIDRIVICGMGGSAISGDIAKLILGNNIKKEIHIIRDYDCSDIYKTNSTLFIMSSYSGNTEETLSMYAVAKSYSDKIICVTTGGELKKRAVRDNISIVSIPSDFQPRAALGYSLMSLMVILNKLDLIPSSSIESILDSIPELNLFYNQSCKKEQYAYKLAKNIYDGLILIYGTSSTSPIVSRFRAQIAENAKILSSDHILPEMNHNEIEGFGSNFLPLISKNVIWIYDKDDHEQILKRIDITSEIFKSMKINNFDISINDCAKDNFTSRTLKLIYLTDWVSYYLAEFNNVDPVPVDIIMKLKNKMA